MKVPGCYSAKVMRSISATTGSSMEARLIARPSVPRAVVLHGTTCFYRNESITFHKRDINTIFIGRYMVERAGFQSGFSNDEYYLAHCSALVRKVCRTCMYIYFHFKNCIFVFNVFYVLCFLRWMRFGFPRNGTAWCSRGLCSRWV